MRNAILFAILTMSALSATALGDVKIKAKQSFSGQTSESTTL